MSTLDSGVLGNSILLPCVRLIAQVEETGCWVDRADNGYTSANPLPSILIVAAVGEIAV